MQQQTATLQTAENSSTQTVEAETDSFVDYIHTGYSECSLDASADLRNETSCKGNRKYILISIIIRASNTLSRSATRKAKPTTLIRSTFYWNLVSLQDNMLFSRGKISRFRAKARLVFHWCSYNRVQAGLKLQSGA